MRDGENWDNGFKAYLAGWLANEISKHVNKVNGF